MLAGPVTGEAGATMWLGVVRRSKRILEFVAVGWVVGDVLRENCNEDTIKCYALTV